MRKPETSGKRRALHTLPLESHALDRSAILPSKFWEVLIRRSARPALSRQVINDHSGFGITRHIIHFLFNVERSAEDPKQ